MWTRRGMHEYRLVRQAASRDAHALSAREDGATLASISDRDTAVFVASLAPTLDVWLGLDRRGGQWMWSDGTRLAWMDFADPPEPHHAAAYLRRGDSKWVSADGSEPKAAVYKRVTPALWREGVVCGAVVVACLAGCLMMRGGKEREAPAPLPVSGDPTTKRVVGDLLV